MKFCQLQWIHTKWPAGRIARLRINGKPASIVQSQHIRIGNKAAYQINYTDKQGQRLQLRYLPAGMRTALAELQCEPMVAA